MRRRIGSWLAQSLGFPQHKRRKPTVSLTVMPLEERQMMSISVGTLQLVRDTGASATDLVTADAALTGQLTGSAEVGYARLEFDHDGDDIVDGEALANSQGGFNYSAGGLPYGSLTIRARGLEWNDETFDLEPGNWTSLSFVFVEEPPVFVGSIALSNDTGTSATDGLTVDPHLVGSLSGLGYTAYANIEFDHDGDATVDGRAAANAQGGFAYMPAGLPYGAVTVSARAWGWDMNQFEMVASPWVPYSFTFQAVERPAATISTLDLANDTGASATDNVSSNPALVGQLSGTGSLAFETIEFDHDGDSTPDGTSLSDSQGAFLHAPRGLSYGSITIQARAVGWDATTEEHLYGSWTTFSFTYVEQALASIADLSLVNDTGTPDDGVTTDSRIAGEVEGAALLSSVFVQLDHNGDDVPDGVAFADAEGAFHYEPPNLTPGAVSLRARTVSREGTGSWTTLSFTLEEIVNQPPAIATFLLLNDTGTSNTDNITTDPTLKGTVTNDGNLNQLLMEFDHDGDGVPDGQVGTNEQGQFTFLPDDVRFGEVTVQARVSEWDQEQAEFLTSPWVSLTFTYESAVDTDLVVSELGLLWDTGTSATDRITTDATLIGKLTTDDTVLGLEVEIDLDNDGAADATIGVDAEGKFTYAPELPYSAATVRARGADYDHLRAGYVYGPWSTLNFTLEPIPNAAPVVATLELAVDNGASPSDLVTAITTLRGTVTDDSSSAWLTVEFDHNEDGVPDDSTTTDDSGAFLYLPSGLTYGEITVHSRASQWDDEQQTTIYGDWVELAFTYAALVNVPVTITGLALVNDTGASATDRITTDATVKGQVVNDGSVALATIEFDFDADNVVDASTTADSEGKFTFAPDLQPGALTVRARAVEWDYVQNQDLLGPWASLSVTLEAVVDLPPVVEPFELLSDSGSSFTDGVTANPLVTGRVSNEQGVAGLLVELDLNGDETPDAAVATDDEGRFLYDPRPLAYGSVSLAARALEWDEDAGDYVAGDWSTLEFTYQSQTNAAPVLASLGLLEDTGSSATDLVTSLATVAGRVTNEADVEGLTIQFDLDDDGTADALTQTDRYGEFSFTPAGAALGTITLAARSREFDEDAATWLNGAWTSFTFTLVAVEDVPPEIEDLALVEDTGSSATDRVSSKAAFRGRVVNDGPVERLSVEIDLDGDDVADALARTDAAGYFRYSPTALPLGSVTVAARAKEWDVSGNAVYGAWTALEFTHVAQRTIELELTEDSGQSDSDRSTSEAAVSGQVTGEDAAGLTVHFDHNGDGLADGSATTDINGAFSYEPDVGHGQVRLRAWTDDGARANLIFVFSADPDNAEALAEAAALGLYEADLELARETHGQQAASANSAFETALDNASGDFYDAQRVAAATYNSTTATANAAYASALATADTNYAAALAQASADFAAAVVAFSGNTTSYEVEAFAWPEAPDAGGGPQFSLQDAPELPFAAPSYTGPSFDFNNDPVFNATMDAARNAAEAAAEQAASDYDDAIEAADDAYTLALNAADQIRQAAYLAADNAHTVAMAATHPNIDLVAEQLAFDNGSGAAYALQSLQDGAALVVFGAQVAVAMTQWGDALAANADDYVAMQDANHAFNLEYHLATTLRDDKFNVHLRTRQSTLAALERTLDTKRAEHDAWSKNKRVTADDVRTKAKAVADKVYEQAKADAELARALAKAAAVRDRTIAEGVAERGLEMVEAVARAAALSTWSTALGTRWSVYQAALAAHKLTYLQAVHPLRQTHVDTVANAARLYDDSLALATLNHDYDVADAERTRTEDRSTEKADFETARNNATWERKRDNLTERLARTTRSLNADDGFNTPMLKVNQKFSDAISECGREAAIRFYNLGMNWLATGVWDEAESLDMQRDYIAAHAQATWDSRKEQYDLRQQRDMKLSQAQLEFALAWHVLEKTWTDTVSTEAANLDTDLAFVEAEHTEDLADAAKTQADDRTAALSVFVTAVANQDRDLALNSAPHARQWAVSDAGSLRTFQQGVAFDYWLDVVAWDALQGSTSGSGYRLAEADAHRAFVNLTADSQYTHSESLADATLAWTNDLAPARRTHVLDELDAEADHAAAAALAVRTHIVDVGWEQYGYVALTALALKDYNHGVAGLNKVLEDEEANRQKLLQDTVDDAEFDYQRTLAQLDYQLRTEAISQAGHAAAADAAQTTRDTRTADAEFDRAVDMAGARQGWTAGLGAEKVAYTAAVGAWYVQLVDGVTAAGVVYITGRADAARTRVRALAVADEVFVNASSLAEADWQTDAADADQTLANAVAGAVKTYQDSVGTAKIDYEKAQVAAHALAVQSWATAEGTLLATYTNDLVQAGQTWTDSVALARIARLGALTTADRTLAQNLNTAARTLAGDQIAADEQFVNSMAGYRTLHAWGVSDAARDYAVHVGQARAARVVDSAEAEEEYGNSVADVQRDFANDLADLGVQWVYDVGLLKRNLHVARDTGPLSASFAADKAVYDAGRVFDERAANVTRVERIGDALIEWAEDEGDADVTLATSLGTHRITFITDVGTANTTFANNRKTVLINWTDQTATAAAAYDNSVAGHYLLWTGQVVTADTGYSSQVGTADVTRADTVTGAEADYHIDVAVAALTAADALALSEPSAEHTFRAAYALAFHDWLSNLKPKYVIAAAGAAGHEATHANQLTIAQGTRANAMATAVQTLVGREGTAAVTFEVAVTTKVETFRAGDVARSGTRQIGVAGADKALNIKLAEAKRAYSMAVAAGEKDYAVALAQNDGTAPDTRPAHNADANLAYVLAKGLANIGWVATAGSVTSTYVVNTALAVRTAQVESAQAQQTFDDAIAYAYTEYDKERGVAEAGYRTGSAGVEAARAIGLVDVEGTFLDQSAEASVTVLNVLASTINTPWAQFLFYKAEAEKLWAADFQSAYHNYQSNLNGLDTAYAGTTSTAYITAVNAIAAADLLLANTLALKALDRDTGVADAEKTYAQDMAPVEEQYANNLATQAKIYAVALATIARDEAADPAFDEVGAQAQADSQNQAALDGWAAAFGYDQAWFSKLQDVDIADAKKVFTTEAANATETNARTVADLQISYATTEANAWRDREFDANNPDAADLAEAFVTGQANNYATYMATMATSHTSPWADRERDVAIEEASRVAAEAAAEKTRRQTQAVTERAKEIAAATAAGNLTKDEALAARDKAIAQASADFDTAEAAADALVDLATAGFHRPAGSYSTGLELSGISHPSSESEWWRFEVDDYYASLIDFMFKTASGCGAWNGYGNNAHDLFDEIGDVLEEEVDLLETPETPQSGGLGGFFQLIVTGIQVGLRYLQSDFAGGTPAASSVNLGIFDASRFAGQVVPGAVGRNATSPLLPQATNDASRAEREALVYKAIRAHAVAEEIRTSSTVADFTPNGWQTFWSAYAKYSDLVQGAIASWNHVGGLIDRVSDGNYTQAAGSYVTFNLGVNESQIVAGSPPGTGWVVKAGLSAVASEIDEPSFQQGQTAAPFVQTVAGIMLGGFLRPAAPGISSTRSAQLTSPVGTGTVTVSPKAYSTAFETQLPTSVLGRSRSVHFNRANAALDRALASDAKFAGMMDELIPGVQPSVSIVGGRQNPIGWTWEHAHSTQAGGQIGVMRLVPTSQHTPGSPWWRILHPQPGAAGGYSEWAIPRGAPPN